jgi:hypothetical protein
VTDFAPDAVLSFFEQTQRAKERRARLWDGVPRRVNEPMPEPEVRSEPVEEITRPTLAEMFRDVVGLAVMASPLPDCDPVPEPEPTPPPKVRFILAHVAAFYGLSMVEIESNRRQARIVRPRQIAMYLARRLTPRSLPEIGRMMGGRDHTTVIHGSTKIEKELPHSETLAADVNDLIRRIDRGEPARAVPPPPLPQRKASLYGKSSPRGIFWTEQRTAEFIRLWNDGLSSDDLAERFGRGRSAINKIGRKLGLTSRIGGRRKKA